MRRYVIFPKAAAASVAWLGSFLALSTFGQSYTIVNLGTPGSFSNTIGDYSLAHCINTAGAVAGEWAPNQTSQRAFLYANGTNTDLGLIPSTLYAIAHALNDSNAVVGEASGEFTGTHAFVYTNGVMVDLGSFAGYSIAHAINNAGVIVGESTVSNGEVHAVICLGGGQQTDLGVLPTGDYSAAFGINNSNATMIVGESTAISGTVTNLYAFVIQNGPMINLGSFAGSSYSAAFAVNDTGQIIGEADTNGQTHAVLWQNSAITDLGTLGGTNSSASAINHAGGIVGYALTASEDEHAFLYSGSTMYDLNNFLPPGSVFTNLISADGINDAGQITGSGYTTNGDYRAFLLTPVLTLTSPKMTAGGQFQMTVQGAPGQRFVLEGSANLVNWVSLTTNTLTSSPLIWADGTAMNFAYRFYRAQALP
jgi:probable HAF family extracellular repeat protein